VTVLVKVPPARAFQVFTEEIDAWWRTGFKFRVSGRRPGVLVWSRRWVDGCSRRCRAEAGCGWWRQVG
jgi:hypothetical protein